MELVFSDDQFPATVNKTIFLAGPNPRYQTGDKVQQSWRHRAIEYLRRYKYDGHVFIPLPRHYFEVDSQVENAIENYDEQIAWEDKAMSRADVLLFFVDRTEEHQGLTTNIEFGRYLDSGRMVYGRPNTALNTRYLDEQVRLRNRVVYEDSASGHDSLLSCVNEAVRRCGAGSTRNGDQTLFPLLFWTTKQFQTWYKNHKSAQNQIKEFVPKLALTYGSGKTDINDDANLFAYVAWANVHIHAENRDKDNEVVFSRSHISAIVPYYLDMEGNLNICLVKEFRTPVNNPKGYVYELPSGSDDAGETNPQETARTEMREETGLHIENIERFIYMGQRQTLATFASTTISLFGLELTELEYNDLRDKAARGDELGETDVGEIINLVMVTEKDLVSQYENYPVDWCTLGMVHLLSMKIRGVY